MTAGWIVPFIILGGLLQSTGAAMNGQLKQSLVNPYLASAVSFALITFLFAALFFIMPHPLPTMSNLASMPWWAPLGGLVGPSINNDCDQPLVAIIIGGRPRGRLSLRLWLCRFCESKIQMASMATRSRRPSPTLMPIVSG